VSHPTVACTDARALASPSATRPAPPAATQGDFCEVFAGEPGKCNSFRKLQSARTFAIILVILSGFGTLALAGTNGSNGSKGFAAVAELGATAAGIIAFATFIDLKQEAEDLTAADLSFFTPGGTFYTNYGVGFACFTAAWLSTLVSFGATLAIAKTEAK
jgi:hypothetical protein